MPGDWGTWVNFCWVYAAGLSEPLPHYSGARSRAREALQRSTMGK